MIKITLLSIAAGLTIACLAFSLKRFRSSVQVTHSAGRARSHCYFIGYKPDGGYLTFMADMGDDTLFGGAIWDSRQLRNATMMNGTVRNTLLISREGKIVGHFYGDSMAIFFEKQMIMLHPEK